MEVIISVIENQPGETIERHIHHGEEAFYVLQGATLETADGKQITLPAGASAINRRDVPHAGLKVLGNTPFKYLAVHIVDKGAKPYDAPPKSTRLRHVSPGACGAASSSAPARAAMVLF